MPAAKPESYYLDGLSSQGLFDFNGWVGQFKGARTRAVLSCKKCGYARDAEVWSVISSRGCPSCAKESSSSKQRSNAEDLVARIKSLHNIKFIGWLGGEYKNQHCKAIVKCLKDGCGYEWSATANSMLRGCGCMRCGKRAMSEKQSKSMDERELELSCIDGLTFVEWDRWIGSSKSKAVMTCDAGHRFSATINSILSKGSGCPKCAKTGFDQTSAGFLYAIRSECGAHVKVGISNNYKNRFVDLKRRTPFKFIEIEIVSHHDGAKIRELEKYYHGKYESSGLSGFDGCTEWLICTSELLAELRTKRPD